MAPPVLHATPTVKNVPDKPLVIAQNAIMISIYSKLLFLNNKKGHNPLFAIPAALQTTIKTSNPINANNAPKTVKNVLDSGLTSAPLANKASNSGAPTVSLEYPLARPNSTPTTTQWTSPGTAFSAKRAAQNAPPKAEA